MIDELQGARALDRFAENAVGLRRRSGLSQADAGLRAGLHRTAVSYLERGMRMPRLDTLLRIAGGIEAEPWELLEGLAWDLDRGRLRGARPDPGRYEVVLAGQRVTRVADGWKKVSG